MGDLRDQRIIRVGVGQQGADAQQDLGDGQGRAPLLLENIQTDGSMGVDVRVVDPGGEAHLRRLEGVVQREVDVQEEKSSLVWGILLREN